MLRAPINFSVTTIRASGSEPLLVGGFLEKVDNEEVFIITSIMDFRALPGFNRGSPPTSENPGDDPGLTIPYSAGGSRSFKLGSENCDGP